MTKRSFWLQPYTIYHEYYTALRWVPHVPTLEKTSGSLKIKLFWYFSMIYIHTYSKHPNICIYKYVFVCTVLVPLISLCRLDDNSAWLWIYGVRWTVGSLYTSVRLSDGEAADCLLCTTIRIGIPLISDSTWQLRPQHLAPWPTNARRGESGIEQSKVPVTMCDAMRCVESFHMF